MDKETFDMLKEKFAATNDLYEIAILALEYPGNEKELFKLLTDKENFNRLVTSAKDLINYTAQFFPTQIDAMLELLLSPDNYARLVTSPDDLIKRKAANQSLPDTYFHKVLEYFLSPDNFTHLINSVETVSLINRDATPETNKKLFSLVIQPENFVRLITSRDELLKLARIFPPKQKIMRISYEITPHISQQPITQILNEAVSSDDVIKEHFNSSETLGEFISIGNFIPEPIDAISKFLKENNFTHLIESAEELVFVAEMFEDNPEMFLSPLLDPDIFDRLIPSLSTIQSVLVLLNIDNVADLAIPKNDAKTNIHMRDKLFSLIIKPSNFVRLVKSEEEFTFLKRMFPDKSILKKGDLKETIGAIIQKYKVKSKAYSEGAVCGMFGKKLPQELSSHISSFLDTNSSHKVAQTRKKAARMAKEELEKKNEILKPPK